MRWSIIVFVSLALACSKRETPAPVEAEEPKAEAPAKPTEPATAEEAKGAEPSVAEGEGEPTAEQPSLPPELEAATPPIDAPPTIQVLDPGKEPRQTLTWKLKPGLKQKLSLELELSNVLVITPITMASPPRTITYDITLTATDSKGAVRVNFAIDEARPESGYLKPQQLKAVKSAAAAMQGVNGSYSLSPQGVVTDFRLELPSEAPPRAQEMADNLAWAFQRMFPALPDVPLGEGAKWTVHRGVQQGGIHANELSSLELTKLQGGRAELGVQLEQAATAQTYDAPVGRGSIKLSAMWGEGQGTVIVDLKKLMPITATTRASVTKSGSKQGVGIVIVTNRSLKAPGK